MVPRPQVLDFGLHHANSAVVMATAKLFLHYTLAFTSQHQQVGRRGAGGAVMRGALLPGRPLAWPLGGRLAASATAPGTGSRVASLLYSPLVPCPLPLRVCPLPLASLVWLPPGPV